MKRALLLALFSAHIQASTVLFVGDSHSVGPFGWALDQHMRDAGHDVATYASCGSIPKWWSTGQKTSCGFFSRDLKGTKTSLTNSPTPLIDSLLADIKPDVVVMEFGGNYLKTPSADYITQDIKSFVKKVKDSGARCLWITQPDSRTNRSEIPRVAHLIKEAIGKDCPIFESYNVTKYPTTGGDGTHYWSTEGTPNAKKWAKAAFDFFATEYPPQGN